MNEINSKVAVEQVVKSMGCEFKSETHHLISSHFASLSLSFLICKMEIITVPVP